MPNVRDMKRTAPHIACLTVLFFIASTVLLVPARAQVGIGGGLDFNRLDAIDATNASATFESSTGYHIGVFLDAEFGPLAIRPGVFYHDVGRYEFSDVGEGLEPEETITVDLSAVEIPIDLRLRLLPGAVGAPYLLAAPVLAFPQSEDEFEGTESFNLTADVGAGIEIVLPRIGMTLMPEFRYGIGTSSFLEDSFEVGDTTIEPQDDPQLDSIMLRLNIRF